jgi:hypothetical protein
MFVLETDANDFDVTETAMTMPDPVLSVGRDDAKVQKNRPQTILKVFETRDSILNRC